MSRFLVLVLVPGYLLLAFQDPQLFRTPRFVPLRIFQIVASCWAADCWLGAVFWVVDGGVAFTCVLNRPFAIFAYTSVYMVRTSIHTPHTTHWLYGSHTDTHLYKFNWLWTCVCACVCVCVGYSLFCGGFRAVILEVFSAVKFKYSTAINRA